MRRLVYVTLFLVWAQTAAGCVAPPTPKEVLATGFLSPEQTFTTFQTALRGDLVDLEYRCLSAEFKREFGLSQLLYIKERARLVSSQPFFKLAATAKILERIPSPDPTRCRLIVRFSSWLVEETFCVYLTKEGFYDVYDDEGVAEGSPAAWNGIVSRDGEDLVLRVPMPEGYGLDELTAIRAGQVWKIAGFEPLSPP